MKRLATKLRNQGFELQDIIEDKFEGNLGLLAALHMLLQLSTKTTLDELYTGVLSQPELQGHKD